MYILLFIGDLRNTYAFAIVHCLVTIIFHFVFQNCTTKHVKFFKSERKKIQTYREFFTKEIDHAYMAPFIN